MRQLAEELTRKFSERWQGRSQHPLERAPGRGGPGWRHRATNRGQPASSSSPKLQTDPLLNAIQNGLGRKGPTELTRAYQTLRGHGNYLQHAYFCSASCATKRVAAGASLRMLPQPALCSQLREAKI